MLKQNLTCKLLYKPVNLNKMKKDTLKTKHVYFDNKKNIVYLKKNHEKWFPINFQWVPIIQLNHELNIESNQM